MNEVAWALAVVTMTIGAAVSRQLSTWWPYDDADEADDKRGRPDG